VQNGHTPDAVLACDRHRQGFDLCQPAILIAGKLLKGGLAGAPDIAVPDTVLALADEVIE
jgi:hypothetical protein